jgi:hypothetical protein
MEPGDASGSGVLQGFGRSIAHRGHGEWSSVRDRPEGLRRALL